MHHFSDPWKHHLGVEKGCIGKEWVNLLVLIKKFLICNLETGENYFILFWSSIFEYSLRCIKTHFCTPEAVWVPNPKRGTFKNSKLVVKFVIGSLMVSQKNLQLKLTNSIGQMLLGTTLKIFNKTKTPYYFLLNTKIIWPRWNIF